MKRMSLIATLLMLLTVLFTIPVAAQTSKPLPQTYVSDDERLTLRYPAGWVLQSDVPGQIIVSTDEALFDLNDESIPSGQAAFGMLFLDSEADLSGLLAVGDDPLSILQTFATVILEDGSSDVKAGTPHAFTFADHPAARMDGTFSGNDLFLMMVDQGGKNYVLYIGITAAGEMPKFEPKLLAIAESVRYLPASQ